MFDPNLLSLFKPRLHYFILSFQSCFEKDIDYKKQLPCLFMTDMLRFSKMGGGTPNHPKIDNFSFESETYGFQNPPF